MKIPYALLTLFIVANYGIPADRLHGQKIAAGSGGGTGSRSGRTTPT
jgi:hypothetical protein